MPQDLSQHGAVVLVTGGVQGVGAGITRAFLERGAKVVTCARNKPEQPVSAGDAQAEFVACDVREPAQVEALVAEVVERHGRLDVLVNNAGGAPFARAGEASARFHDKLIQLNLLAPLNVAQHANAVMQRQDSGGSVVMISSVRGPGPRRAPPPTARRRPVSTTSSAVSRWSGHRRSGSTRSTWAWCVQW